MRSSIKFLAATAAFATLLLGCSISDQKKDGSENVDIRTPVGGMKVQTNIDPKDVGLAVYPGARLKPSEDSDHDKSANVNMNTPFFKLKVVALDYESDDPPEKVLDFYKKDLSRYGSVLECKGMSGNGASMHSDGSMKLELKCDSNDHGDSVQLKAGSGSAQHVVGVKPSGKGSEFGLVYIQFHGSGETI